MVQFLSGLKLGITNQWSCQTANDWISDCNQSIICKLIFDAINAEAYQFVGVWAFVIAARTAGIIGSENDAAQPKI